MAGRASSAARKRAHARCRDRRRKAARKSWVQPYKRATFALKAAYLLLKSTMHIAASCERQALHNPVEASRRLRQALHWLEVAAERLRKAGDQLAEAHAWMTVTPNLWEHAPEALTVAFAQFTNLSAWVVAASNEIAAAHKAVHDKVVNGEIPLAQPRVRRRIVVAPPIHFVRAVLASRRRRAIADRINPILRRRRRTPRPAGLRVPRRSVLGRAPPLSSLCAL